MVRWFKRHPNFLIKESTALSNDPNYKEHFQVRNNLFLSHGEILVRLEQIHRFPILIVYTETTPFSLPLIYPLKETLAKEEIERLESEGDGTNIAQLLASKVKLYHYFRHQNKDGSLCIIEWDSLEDGMSFYGINTVIQRVKDWFRGTITGEFPPDSQEVEFCAHFTNVDPFTSLLYSENFLRKGSSEGEAYGVLFHEVPLGKFQEKRKLIYSSGLMLGTRSNGLLLETDIQVPPLFVANGISSVLEISTKNTVLNKLITEEKVIKMYWFDINETPSSFTTLTELITIVGNGRFDSGLQRMRICLPDMKSLLPSIFVAIRFPNNRGEREFQLFRLKKKPADCSTLINSTDEETFKHLLDCYSEIWAVPCEPFTDKTLHERNATLANRGILKERSIVLLGVGALGSEIGDSMSKAGIGELTLVDNQNMKANNPVRHLAGLDYVGIPKVFAVADILVSHNPFVRIKVLPVDARAINFGLKEFENSIFISAIAEDNPEGFINEKALLFNKTVYYVRAVRGGKVARIIRVIPGRDACFNCLNLYRQEKKLFIQIPPDPSFPNIRTECNNPIRPASAADLKLISALASKIVLNELQGGHGDKNHWIWATEKIDTIEPYTLTQQSIPPHQHCQYCQQDKKIRILLPSEIQENLKELVLKEPTIETGGVLAGYTNEDGDYVITDVSGPGPKAIRKTTIFERDSEYCQNFLDKLFVESKKRKVYLGEWHSHPSKSSLPSGTDISSLTAISLQQNYLTDKPAMIIFSNTGIPSATIHTAGKLFYHTDFIT